MRQYPQQLWIQTKNRVLLASGYIYQYFLITDPNLSQTFKVGNIQQLEPNPHPNDYPHLSESWSTGTRHASSRGLILPRTESVTLVSSTITSNRSPTSSFTILERVSTTPDIHLPRKRSSHGVYQRQILTVRMSFHCWGWSDHVRIINVNDLRARISCCRIKDRLITKTKDLKDDKPPCHHFSGCNRSSGLGIPDFSCNEQGPSKRSIFFSALSRIYDCSSHRAGVLETAQCSFDISVSLLDFQEVSLAPANRIHESFFSACQYPQRYWCSRCKHINGNDLYQLMM